MIKTQGKLSFLIISYGNVTEKLGNFNSGSLHQPCSGFVVAFMKSLTKRKGGACTPLSLYLNIILNYSS